MDDPMRRVVELPRLRVRYAGGRVGRDRVCGRRIRRDVPRLRGVESRRGTHEHMKTDPWYKAK